MRNLYILLFTIVLLSFSGFASGQASQVYEPVRVLMFDFCSYDPFYTDQVSQLLSKHDIQITRINSCQPSFLTELQETDLVIITYPHKGTASEFAQLGMELRSFIRQGGLVVVTGTHEISKINMLKLLQMEKGSYNPVPNISLATESHLLTRGLPNQFSSRNFSYPVVVNDVDFISLANDQERTVFGYLPFGKGMVVYLGMEFYHLEQVNQDIMANVLDMVRKPKAIPARTTVQSTPGLATIPDLRSLDVLENKALDWKIYPNPFFSKAQIDFQVINQAQVEITVFNEVGIQVLKLANDNTYDPGKYSFELNDLPYGVFFVQCRIGDQISVKRIVRIKGA